MLPAALAPTYRLGLVLGVLVLVLVLVLVMMMWRIVRMVLQPAQIELAVLAPVRPARTVSLQWHRALCGHDFAIQVVTVGPDDDGCSGASVDVGGLLEIPLAVVSSGCFAEVEAMHGLHEDDVAPGDADREMMIERGATRITGLVKFCTGGPPRTEMLQSTGYRGYDEKLLAVVRGWRFDSPEQACGILGFSYQVD